MSIPRSAPDHPIVPARLVLGTAQLGMSYGIANRIGQPAQAEATAIVSAAWTHGVRTFDTAPAYGESEAVLGRAFHELAVSARAGVVSKFGPDWLGKGATEIERSLEATLLRLGVSHLSGMLAHDEAMLDAPLPEGLLAAQRRGLVRGIGFSVYSPERALEALEMDACDLIQVPANVFDRRMRDAGVFARAAQLGKTVFVRSVFLQGLVRMPASEVPATIVGARRAVESLHDFCEQRGIARGDFAMAYVRAMAPQAELIVGAESVAQVVENCRSAARQLPAETFAAWEETGPADRVSIYDPRSWSRSISVTPVTK
jgi:aryl-alcohol dehydrogenase-like predicted oxidoreductase